MEKSNYNKHELILERKAEDLFNKIYPNLRNFPSNEQNSLCEQMKINFIELIKYINLGKSVKSKRKDYIQQADGYLQTLKVIYKISLNQNYISQGYHEIIDTSLSEINRLLVNYLKNS